MLLHTLNLWMQDKEACRTIYEKKIPPQPTVEKWDTVDAKLIQLMGSINCFLKNISKDQPHVHQHRISGSILPLKNLTTVIFNQLATDVGSSIVIEENACDEAHDRAILRHTIMAQR